MDKQLNTLTACDGTGKEFMGGWWYERSGRLKGRGGGGESADSL